MNILNEKRYVWFAGKKYITTFKRLSELMQQTVKSAMPEGYKFNFVQSSVSTESIYFSIPISYTHIRAHETDRKFVSRRLFETNKTEYICLFVPYLQDN
ncbi:hypothetical protein HQ675_13170 [Enterococcus faecium]|nr:hypothetical protein [Enterococcus faecium]